MQDKYSKKIEINKVRIEFTNKKMTAYAGFSLLAGFFEKIKLKDMLEAVIPIHEISPNKIDIYDKVIGYSLILYAGGTRFSHLLYLGCKEILCKLFGAKRLPLASTTLTRLFTKLKSFKSAESMSEGLWNYLEKLIPWSSIKEDWLSFDSTVLERYGKQEGVKRGYNPKKKGRGSHSPLIGFLNRTKYVINLWNRPGNVASWNNIIGFFESTWARINKHIRIKGVIADSGFYLLKFIERLEAKELIYIIAVRISQPVQRKIYRLDSWEEISDGIWISEFTYMPEKWGKERRYIVVRQDITKREKAMGKQLKLFEFDTRDYRYSVWITNSEDAPYQVWKQCKPRANDENTIKELKEDFALGGFSLKYFYSTEAAMLIRVLIYNLFELFRHEILEQREKRERLKTLRYKYFVMPALLGKDGRSHVLRVSTHSKKVRSKMKYLFSRIQQYFPVHIQNCNAVKT